MLKPASLPFKQLHPNAILPQRSDEGSVGYDLHCLEPFRLHYLQQRKVPLGFACAIPDGHYGRLAPRSGLADRIGLVILGGVIDRSYRNEWQLLIVMTKMHFPREGVVEDFFDFAQGDRVAQLIVEACATPEACWVDELDETGRKGGFGSTGLAARALP